MTKRAYADTIEDVEFILANDTRALAVDIAARLGYVGTSGLFYALQRGGRDDLADRLARNAALAGHNVTRRRT